MIRAVIVVNNTGKVRLAKFYDGFTIQEQQRIIRETYTTVHSRPDSVCNFLDAKDILHTPDILLVYRQYALLYFAFYVDASESELGILDLIQVFVETLDECFEGVSELDLIFHMETAEKILGEMVMGGLVMQVHKRDIVDSFNSQKEMEMTENKLLRMSATVKDLAKSTSLKKLTTNPTALNQGYSPNL